MALGPRKHGARRRLIAKPRRRRHKAALSKNESPWSPAAYLEREARRQRENQAAVAGYEPPPLREAPVIENARTLPADADGSDQRRQNPPAREPHGDAGVPECDWTLAAFAAREDMRRTQQASPPIMESDWTLEAYRERSEKLSAAAHVSSGSVIQAPVSPTAPEIQIDFPPAWLERPELRRGGVSLRGLIFAGGAVAMVATGALMLRTETQVSTSPPTPAGGLKSRLQPAPLPAPAAPAPAVSIPSPAQPTTPPQAPPAPGLPPSAAVPAPESAPALKKMDAGGQPAIATTPERTTESRSSTPRKPRAAETRQKPARERQRAGRSGPSWFDEMVNSVKRLGRKLMP